MKKVRILRDNLVRILSRVYHKQSLPTEFSHRTRGSRHAMDPDQEKTDFLNLIESSFRLLEKAREAALSATNSTEGSFKSNSSSESVNGTGNGRTKLLEVG